MSIMHTPEFVGLGEMMAMFNVGRTRITAITRRANFPKPYLHLHIGKIWRLKDIVDWAQDVGRRITLPIPEPGETVTLPLSALPLSARGPNNYTGGALGATPETGGVTISSVEEQVVETGEKPQSPTFASLTTSTDLADPPNPPPGVAETPTRRTTIEMNRLALAEDWDSLEKIYAAAKKGDELPESSMQLVGFASMVIANQANVPNYRRTKESMIRAWNDVRRAYSPTPQELVALAHHVVDQASTPFVPGAVKKFSDFEIAKLRRTAPKSQPGQANRWQGSHGVNEDRIAALSPEEKKLYGVNR